MAEYASASMINGQGDYPLRSPSIHGTTNDGASLVFSPPGPYPPPTFQEFLMQTMMPISSHHNGLFNPLPPATAAFANGQHPKPIFPVIVSCSSGLGTFNDPAALASPLSYLPPAPVTTTLGVQNPFDTLKSIDTLPPHEETR